MTTASYMEGYQVRQSELFNESRCPGTHHDRLSATGIQQSVIGLYCWANSDLIGQ